MEQEEWDELDGMAFAAIQLTLTNEVRRRDNLCIDDDYPRCMRKPCVMQQQYLMKRLSKLKMTKEFTLLLGGKRLTR